MAKFCSNCGKKLDENVDVCLKCGVLINDDEKRIINGKEKKRLPIWAIVLIVFGCLMIFPLVILLGLICIFSFGRGFLAREFKNDDIVDDFKDVLHDIEKYEEEYEVTTAEGGLLDTLEIDGIRFTLNKVSNYSHTDNSVDKESNYLVCFLEVENTNDEEKFISNFSFSGIVDDEKVMPSFLFGNIDGISRLNKNLEPGEKISGYVVFEVDDGWEYLELKYERVIVNSVIVFKVYNEEENTDESV